MAQNDIISEFDAAMGSMPDENTARDVASQILDIVGMASEREYNASESETIIEACSRLYTALRPIASKHVAFAPKIAWRGFA